ncbi:MAG: hypothetical protein ACXWLM_01255 [Myxococcales bacterium]
MAEDAQRLVPDCRVTLDSAPLPKEKAAALTRVAVDLDVDLFAQCVLTFNDPKLELINSKDFASGTPIKVELGTVAKRQPVFEGEVVRLEPQFRRDMPPSLRVVCLDSLHRLALSQMTRSLNDVDDKEIVNKIAQEHGLSADAPAGSKRHNLQSNVTDLVLLRRIARKDGNHVRISGKQLVVGPPAKGAEVALGPGSGVAKMKVRIDARGQVGEVSVHGWDPVQKREIVGKAKPEGEVGEGAKQHGGSASLSFAGHEHSAVDPATAEAMAKGRLRKIAERFVIADVHLRGDPLLLPGAQVKVDKLGAQADGTWRVEKAIHQYNKHGYWVEFRAVRVAKAKPPPAKPAEKPPPPEREPPPPDKHVVHVTVKSIGGTILPNHPVRIVDEKGIPIGDPVLTDKDGNVKVEVPENKKYRVEIVDEHIPAPVPLVPPEKSPSLVCHFLTPEGAPVANESVEATTEGHDKVTAKTDENGRLEMPAFLAAYELKIKGETFHAHALPFADKEKKENLYQFVVGLGPPSDVHILAAEVKSTGGTPLVNHDVAIVDPDSGDEVAKAKTDEKGHVRVEVPESKTYRIRILDGDAMGADLAFEPDDKGAALVCHFLDQGGAPIANEKVEATTAGHDKVVLTTDENGRVEMPAMLAAYELKIKDETFQAHALPFADKVKEENLYRFVVGLGPPSDVHILAAQVKSVGGTPLVNHEVSIVDPDSEVEVAHAKTNENGEIQVEVPENKTYRIRISDADGAPADLAFVPEKDKSAVLICHFMDEGGAPIANEKVQASGDGDTIALTTDPNGRIEMPARLADYELKIKDQAFHAHALPFADKDKEENLYRFVIGGQTAAADAHVLAATVKTIGGTPLLNHDVRVIDPDSNLEIATAKTDDKGNLRVEVPEDKTYRIAIANETLPAAADPLLPEKDKGAVVACEFVDAAGAPIAGAKVRVGSVDAITDARGRVEVRAPLAAYPVEIGGKSFTAHAIPVADQRDEHLSRFIVEPS